MITSAEKRDKQYLTNKTIVFKTSGVIVPQDKTVQTFLDAHFVGESELKEGIKYFVTLLEDKPDKDEKFYVTIVLLRSQTDGKFSWELKISDYVGWI